MRPARKTVIIDGVERLLAEVLREHGVSFSVFSQRVANGWPTDDAATIAAGAMRRSRPGRRKLARATPGAPKSHRTLFIDGVERAASDVCREHGVSRQLFAERLSRGWDAARAAMTHPRPRIPCTVAIDGVERSLADVLREHDVSSDVYRERIEKGWTEVDAATITPGETPRSRTGPKERWRDVTDGQDVGLRVTAEANGIGKHTMSGRIKAGWPACMAAILPAGELGYHSPEEMRNRPVVVTDGHTKSVTSAAREQGLSMKTVYARLRAEWPLAMALIVPAYHGQSKVKRETLPPHREGSAP